MISSTGTPSSRTSKSKRFSPIGLVGDPCCSAFCCERLPAPGGKIKNRGRLSGSGKKNTIPCRGELPSSLLSLFPAFRCFCFLLAPGPPDTPCKRRSSGTMNAISALVLLFSLYHVSLSEAFSTYLVEERAEVCFFRYVESKTALHAKVRMTGINGVLALASKPRSPTTPVALLFSH